MKDSNEYVSVMADSMIFIRYHAPMALEILISMSVNGGELEDPRVEAPASQSDEIGDDIEEEITEEIEEEIEEYEAGVIQDGASDGEVHIEDIEGFSEHTDAS